ncbi:MAG: c-type cytochrome [Magnetospiraceae bacterium]
MGSVPDPDHTNQLAYGEYLAGPLGHCKECHTPMIKGHFDYENYAFAGGFAIPGPWGVSVSANLTPHPEDGIAGYADAEIIQAITTGVIGDRKLRPPMPFGYYANMTQDDLNAIVAYLRSLPPIASPE